MDKFQLLAFNKLAYVPEDIENIIIERGVTSGSRAYGGFDKLKSDIDILLLAEAPFDGTLLSTLSHNQIIVPKDYNDDGFLFDSYYVKCRFTKYPVNLIILRTKGSYTAWVRATEALKTLYKNQINKPLLEDKDRRVSLFEAFQSFYGVKPKNPYRTSPVDIIFPDELF